MAVLEIELRIEENGSSFFKIASNLSGRVYDLTFYWSHRWLCWYMNVDETLFGIKVVNSIDLLGPYHYNGDVPPGQLTAYINQGRSSKPSFFNFGIEKEVTLIYNEP